MRLLMRLLILIALPGLMFSWIAAAVRSFFLPMCGESQLLSLLERPSRCTLAPFEAALIGSSVAVVAIVTLLVARVVAPSLKVFSSST